MADDAALVDTDVFSLVIVTPKDADPRVALWRRILIGKDIALAAQTAAELLFGARRSNWGSARLDQLRDHIDSRIVIPTTSAVCEAWAQLRSECLAEGHALGGDLHKSDAWVAATAIAYDLPLLSGDGIYRGAPRLRLLSEE